VDSSHSSVRCRTQAIIFETSWQIGINNNVCAEIERRDGSAGNKLGQVLAAYKYVRQRTDPRHGHD
jgi:hypothetical protein